MMNPNDVQAAAQSLLQQLVQPSGLPQQVAVAGSLPVNLPPVLAVAPVTSSRAVNNVHITTSGQPQPDKRRVQAYTYKVKVINPRKKSDIVLRHLNGHTDRFESVTEMKTNLIEEFGDQVPSQLDFSVGYYDRSQKAKTWLVIKDHLDALYKKYPNGGNTALWCDGRSTDSAPK